MCIHILSEDCFSSREIYVCLVVDQKELLINQALRLIKMSTNLSFWRVELLSTWFGLQVDRATSRLNGEVENEVFDLFVNLNADDSLLEYPVLFASAKQGSNQVIFTMGETRSS